MTTIDLGILADGPHAELICEMAERCLADERILAIWVGGSLASGKGDQFSDIDFRIAVAAGTVDEWSKPEWTRFLPEAPVGAIQMRFGPGTLLHHMVLGDGAIVDLLIMDTETAREEPDVVVLGARSPELRAQIESYATPAVSLVKAIEPETLRNFLVDYWIASHKQGKAMGRGFDESSFVGLYVERMALLRAWFMEATGKDIEARMSLHMLGALHKGLAGRLSHEQEALVGMPTRTRVETMAAIEAVRTEMARVGRSLAQQHQVAYPHALEEVVHQAWAAKKGTFV